MLEKILQAVIQAMTPSLRSEQLDELENVLYIQFHGVQVIEEKYEMVESVNGNEAKINAFIGSKHTTGRKMNTLKQYSTEIHKMLQFLGKKIEDITTMDLRYYYSVSRQNGIAMSTMQTRLHYLSSFWDFLTVEGLVTDNPVRRIGSLMLERTIKKPFSQEDLEALRVNCGSLRDRALMEFLYSTGVRVSELVALNVEDIEMGKQELIVYGKGSKERRVYLTDNAKFYLKRYLRERCSQTGTSMEELGNRPLFATLDRPFNRLTVAGVQYMLRQLGKRSGIAHVHPHRFRRTIATDLLSRGMPVEQVKEYLGHEKLDTTMIYCTVKEQNVRESFRKYA
ncbi:integrase [Clostridium sp. chh4-2]|uniref:tyrosine-type recombinase/integrase n=1 Tax=Clostridium sp. chh4-2 TaxID=2067550 RepID=UPI000CCEC683|nr:tyrosine-type recombinase/integrase [Clostridium sp. chh4-2]PNV58935.1 integrase [Clostridium sp. chh4-2]